MHIIAQAYCKNERNPYWNTTCGFNLLIVVIIIHVVRRRKVTTFAYLSVVPCQWKIASEFTRKIMEQILTVQYTA